MCCSSDSSMPTSASFALGPCSPPLVLILYKFNILHWNYQTSQKGSLRPTFSIRTHFIFFFCSIIMASVADALLLQRYPHHRGNHQYSTRYAYGIWPHSHECDLQQDPSLCHIVKQLSIQEMGSWKSNWFPPLCM